MHFRRMRYFCFCIHRCLVGNKSKKTLRQGENISQKEPVKADQTLCKVILSLVYWLTFQNHVAVNQLWSPDISWIQPVIFADAVFTFT